MCSADDPEKCDGDCSGSPYPCGSGTGSGLAFKLSSHTVAQFKAMPDNTRAHIRRHDGYDLGADRIIGGDLLHSCYTLDAIDQGLIEVYTTDFSEDSPEDMMRAREKELIDGVIPDIEWVDRPETFMERITRIDKELKQLKKELGVK